jgi:hypothetical protein
MISTRALASAYPQLSECSGPLSCWRAIFALTPFRPFFTIDMLVNMLARAGKKVVLQTRRKKAA